MNKETHIAIAKRAYDLLPEIVRDFLNATEDEISFWAVYPDSLDKDNIDFGYWMHSRKMKKIKKGFIWKHGSVSGAILGLRWNFRTYYRTGDFENAKKILLKMFHYCTDMCTLPHLVFKEADFLHSAFEKEMSKKVFVLVQEIRVNNLPISSPRSVYDSATELMQEVFTEQKDILIDIYSKGKSINDFHEIKMNILRTCIQACVDFVSHVYLGVSKENNYLEEVNQ